jgi:hypothetical protein
MRWILRLAAVVVALLVLALGALALLLPRVVESEAVRARLEALARESTGREVRWERLAFGLLPPRLVVDRPTVASQRGSGPPDLEVEQVDLRLALLPLLARTVVIDSLALEGVTLRVTRGPEGIELPVAPVPAGAEPVPAPPGSEEPEAGALRVALGEVRLTRSRLILEDRAVAPAVTWDLGDVELRARGSTLDGPIDVALSGELASGGHVGVEGKVRLDGEVDLAVKLDDLALVRASPYLAEYLGPKGGLAGTLVARVVAKGPVASPTRLEADVRLADGRVETGDVRLLGGATLRADLEGGLEAASGTFELDATDAELVYGESFHKPRGMPAKLAGRLVPGKDGQLAIEDLRVRAANLEASGKLRGGAPTRVELAAVRSARRHPARRRHAAAARERNARATRQPEGSRHGPARRGARADRRRPAGCDRSRAARPGRHAPLVG